MRSQPRGQGWYEDLWSRGLVAQGSVRRHGVVMSSPAFDDDLALGERIEDFTIQKFIAKPIVERLDEAILSRAARHDVGCLGPDCGQPVSQRLSNELRTIVGANMDWDTAQDKEIREHVNDVNCLQPSINPDGNAFACELIDDVEHPILPPLMCPILDEVVGPDVVGIFRAQPHT